MHLSAACADKKNFPPGISLLRTDSMVRMDVQGNGHAVVSADGAVAGPDSEEHNDVGSPFKHLQSSVSGRSFSAAARFPPDKYENDNTNGDAAPTSLGRGAGDAATLTRGRDAAYSSSFVDLERRWRVDGWWWDSEVQGGWWVPPTLTPSCSSRLDQEAGQLGVDASGPAWPDYARGFKGVWWEELFQPWNLWLVVLFAATCLVIVWQCAVLVDVVDKDRNVDGSLDVEGSENDISGKTTGCQGDVSASTTASSCETASSSEESSLLRSDDSVAADAGKARKELRKKSPNAGSGRSPRAAELQTAPAAESKQIEEVLPRFLVFVKAELSRPKTRIALAALVGFVIVVSYSVRAAGIARCRRSSPWFLTIPKTRRSAPPPLTKTLPRRLWSFWHSGTLSSLNQALLDRWKLLNPSVELHLLQFSRNSIERYLRPEELPHDFFQEDQGTGENSSTSTRSSGGITGPPVLDDKITSSKTNSFLKNSAEALPPNMKDFLMLSVLYKYGGVAVDVSTIPLASLDWLFQRFHQKPQTELAGYYNSDHGLPDSEGRGIMEMFFLAAKPGSVVVRAWLERAWMMFGTERGRNYVDCLGRFALDCGVEKNMLQNFPWMPVPSYWKYYFAFTEAGRRDMEQGVLNGRAGIFLLSGASGKNVVGGDSMYS